MTAGDYDSMLDRLADLAGIEDGWWDFFGHWHPVPQETKRQFLAAMGFAVADQKALSDSLHDFETLSWRRWLEPVGIYRHEDGQAIDIPISLAQPDDAGGEIAWSFVQEDGRRFDGTLNPEYLPNIGEQMLAGQGHRRRLFRLPPAPPLGYHEFSLERGGRQAKMQVIVAPSCAYVPPKLRDGCRVWGLSTQLYALRSARNWGCGDYTDLRNLMQIAGRMGAASVGVNPLHALFDNKPERFSPYFPSSRLHVNTTYIAIEDVPDFAESQAAQDLVQSAEYQRRIAEMRAGDLVDYAMLLRLKHPVFEALWRSFAERHLRGESERGRDFRQFQDRQGFKFAQFATFEALQKHFAAQDPALGWWRRWPEAYRNPRSREVAEFREQHRDRVEFFEYLQWIADGQLRAAHQACRDSNMPVGLYTDLAVGIADDGAEAWAQQGRLALDVSVGAPPDLLNLKGQDWGLAPFNPIGLREDAYRPFTAVLQSVMRHAGAMRLDHAMSLQRLYWIPKGAQPDQGGYIRFPLDDLLALVALESHRNRCLVIGEDLGTLPEGFRGRMLGAGLYAYRLMYFERREDDEFKSPRDYDRNALVSVGTHDLPSLRGWWQGLDLKIREDLNLYPREGMDQDFRQGRQADRERLVRALQAEDLLEGDFPTGPELSDAQAVALAHACHHFIDRAPTSLMMVQIEDVLGQSVEMNMPGTFDECPNWRQKLGVEIEEIAEHPEFVALARRLALTRCEQDRQACIDIKRGEQP